MRRVCPHCGELIRSSRSWRRHRARECLSYWEVLATAASCAGGATLKELCAGSRPSRARRIAGKLVALGYMRMTEDGRYLSEPGALIALALMPRVPSRWLTRVEALTERYI